jgi:iron complex transport system substrate-binding protein
MDSPLRIASLISSGTEILFALGLGKSIVAVSHECDFPPEAAAKPKATISHVDSSQPSQAIDKQVQALAASRAALYELDHEQLIALVPDLIVTQAQCDVCSVRYADVMALVREHDRLNDTKVLALNPQSLEDVFEDIRKVGAATEKVTEATTFISSLRRRVERIQCKTQFLAATAQPRVICIEWIKPLMLAANWVPELIEIAGGRCALTVGGQHSTYSSWDNVIRYDPEVVVVMPCGFSLQRTVLEATSLASWNAWQTLSAVRENRVFAVDGNNFFNRSGPRLVDSLELLAHLLHPTRFDPPGDLTGAWRKLSTATDGAATTLTVG